MLDQLLNPAAGRRPYRRRSSHVDGAWSILTGIGVERRHGAGADGEIAELLKDADIRL